MNFTLISKSTKDILATSAGKSFTLLGITILTIIFFVVFAIRPSLVKISEIQREVSDNNIYSQKLQNKIENLNKISNQIENGENSDKLDFFQDVFPNSNDVHELILNISSLASKNNLKFSAASTELDQILSDDEAGLNSNLKKYKVLFNFTGDANGFMSFVEQIASYPRAMNITSINMSKDTEGKYIFSFEITAYYLNI